MFRDRVETTRDWDSSPKRRRVYSRWGWQLRYLVATVRRRLCGASAGADRPSMKPAPAVPAPPETVEVWVAAPGTCSRTVNQDELPGWPSGRSCPDALPRCVGNPEQFMTVCAPASSQGVFDSFLFSQVR